MAFWLCLGVIVGLYVTVIFIEVHRRRQWRHLIEGYFQDLDRRIETLYVDAQVFRADTVGQLQDIARRLHVTAERLTDFEQKPAEIVTVEIPIVPANATVQQIGVGAGPSPREEVALIFRDETGNEVGRTLVDRRKRAPEVRWGGHVYGATKKTAEGWFYTLRAGR